MNYLLDKTDCEIVRILQKNARLSNKELAYEIGLSPSSCLERVRRLQDQGIFEGFHAELHPPAVGIGMQAMIAVRLTHHALNTVEAFREYILTNSAVIGLFHVTGANDFLIHVAVTDANHLRSLLLSAFSTRPEVTHIETSIIFEYTRRFQMPVYTKKEV
ncbi:MAG: Lrp/AsnC family transcriptional regulator [Rhodothermia bacterium]|nr:Lrp/AsnC family transcriptional regulator [Rhodothermia bacterium]